jgi:hypothetical protein
VTYAHVDDMDGEYELQGYISLSEGSTVGTPLTVVIVLNFNMEDAKLGAT